MRGAAELTARALLTRLVVFKALSTCSKLRVCIASNTLNSDGLRGFSSTVRAFSNSDS
ncbi:hypothetical protein D3C71_1814220 [compost metagenome]